MTGLITTALIALLVPLLYLWLAKKFPAPELKKEGLSLESLLPKYRKWETRLTLVYIVLWLPVTAVLYLPLHYLAKYRGLALQEGPESLVYIMETAAYLVPAVFMAILVSGVVISLSGRKFKTAAYAEFERYLALRHGFDQQKVMRILSVFLCTLCALLVILLLDSYAVAAPNQLTVNTILGGERKYSYSEVTQVITAPTFTSPTGKEVHRRLYVLKFRDGTTYTTNNMPKREILGRPTSDFIRYVMLKSNAPLLEQSVLRSNEL
jgi:hypothetical protein